MRTIGSLIVVLTVTFALSARAFAGEVEDAQLIHAIRNLDISGVEAALAAGANPNVDTGLRGAGTPLSATMEQLLSGPQTSTIVLLIAQELFAKGARLQRSDHGILYYPISRAAISVIHLLIEHGASVVATVSGGYRPTEVAIEYGQQEAYDLLLKAGAPPVDNMVRAQIQLVHAAASGDVPAMEAALAAGAHVNFTDPSGSTPLFAALRFPIATNEDLETVKWLLAHHADPNHRIEDPYFREYSYPLDIAIVMSALLQKHANQSARMRDLIDSLLSAGAWVSTTEEATGMTPLHLAARSDNLVAAEILVGHAARVMARDKEGKRPLDYAKSSEMIIFLKKHGATEQ